MGEDVRGAREFEEPAFPQGARPRTEPPLSVGTWVEADAERPSRPAPADPDEDGTDRPAGDVLAPERMVEAAVPRARGARRVLPGEDDDLPASPRVFAEPAADLEPEPDEDETTVRLVKARVRRPPVATAPRTDDAAVPRPRTEQPDLHPVTAPEPVAHADRQGVHEHPAEHPAVHPDAMARTDTGPQFPYRETVSDSLAPAAWFRPAPAGPPPGMLIEPPHETTSPGTYEPVLVEPGPQPSRDLAVRGPRHSAEARDPAEEAPAEIVPGPELRTARSPFEIALMLCAPAFAVLALLYYFGWARSAAMADFLGFDEDVLGYSTKEYLLRSVDTLYRPMLAIVGVLLAARMVHPYVLVRLRRHRRAAARLSLLLRCAWLFLPVATWTLLFRWPGHREMFWPLLLPLALTAGVLVSAYGVLLSRQLGTHRRATGMGVRPWSLSVVLTSSAVVLCLFWALGAYAQAEGQTTAVRMVKGLSTRTAVVVYSGEDLRIAADQGVTVEPLAGQNSPYRFRYAGLRLLRRADNRLFLLPDHWSWDRPRLIVVREDPGIRVEYLRAR